MGTTNAGLPLDRLETPYRYQGQRLEKMNMWKRLCLMANETGRRMTETGRDDVPVKQQLAWYQSLGRCWSPVMWTEGSEHRDRMAWQRQPR